MYEQTLLIDGQVPNGLTISGTYHPSSDLNFLRVIVIVFVIEVWVESRPTKSVGIVLDSRLQSRLTQLVDQSQC